LLQRDTLDDTHLLDILRTKDVQIVDLEFHSRDHRKLIDQQETEIAKIKEDIKTYQHMLEVRKRQVDI
jgi:hypothetical protein